MTPDLRQRLRRLLLGLPCWETEEGRREFFSTTLRGHAIWDDLNPKGAAAVVADRLLDLEETHGWEPFRTLLAGLRERESTNPQLRKEIDAIDELLRSRGRRKRETWTMEPYRGLLHFDKRHAAIFFGREAETEALLRTISGTEQGRRFCIVVGASGSGKSSLVRAGLWARLEAGNVAEIPGSQDWLIHAMTPTQFGSPDQSLRISLQHALSNHDRLETKQSLVPQDSLPPLDELAEALLGHDPEARWLLILDQMEELFTAFSKETAEAFFEQLIAATRPPSRFQVLATLRSDFYRHCLDYEPLRRIVGKRGGTQPLGKPGRLAMERMVSGPLLELDLPVPWILDADLPPAIAIDAERQPGGLALMAYSLQQLYSQCLPNHRLELAIYRSPQFGGLSGVITRSADETLAKLGDGAEQALSRVFVRLVHVAKGEAATRRRAKLAVWAGDPTARKLVDAFIRARLLTTDRDESVEVAHEALLREWPRLTGWIEHRRKAFELADRVRTEAHAWLEGDRPWRPEQIDGFRAQLEEAGLLHHLLEDEAVKRLLTPEVEWILAELASLNTSPRRRWEIGDRLAQIGDPRPGVGVTERLPDILWRAVPPGEVLLDEDQGYWPVKSFHIAAYPVTFAQFREFLNTPEGYSNTQWWEGLEQIGMDEKEVKWRSGPANHPVTNVSWYDSAAFCRWLASQMGQDIRLPYEQEWQWAAQSALPDFCYPWGRDWGDGRANTAEAEIRRTTAVGSFPQGDSHQKVSDLAGNVWEWCNNTYQSSVEVTTVGPEPRVLRGGSWMYGAELAKAACRSKLPPGEHRYRLGFRPVYSSPIR